jgi:hypothetical protein
MVMTLAVVLQASVTHHAAQLFFWSARLRVVARAFFFAPGFDGPLPCGSSITVGGEARVISMPATDDFSFESDISLPLVLVAFTLAFGGRVDVLCSGNPVTLGTATVRGRDVVRC